MTAGEGGAEARIARRGRGIDLEKGGAAGVVTEVDDLEVQLAVVACRIADLSTKTLIAQCVD